MASHPPRWGMPPRRSRGVVLTAVLVAVLGLVGLAPPALASGCARSTMYVSAHEDDSFLFMSPDLLDDVRAGSCVQTVFVTAGDANRDASYWSGREDGAKAAYASMAGAADQWQDTTQSVAGHQVRVSRLAADPDISLVFLRLPEGASLTGDGGSTYGYQSIKKLWYGTLAQVSTVDGAATYTRQGLIDTLQALMAAAQPSRIGTHDVVGSPGDPDNVDHYVTAYFTQAAHAQYPVPHTLVSYLGYASQTLPVNVSGADYSAKSAAFYAYTPHDPLICQSQAACAARPESAWLARQYVVSSDEVPAPAPQALVDVARSATATASSSDGAQTPDRAIDGVVGGYPEAPLNEWSSKRGTAGTWFQLSWSSSQALTRVVLHDRPNPADQVTAGLLQFSDGSQVAVSSLPNDGSGATVSFSSRDVSWVRFTVTSTSATTQNVGLAEVEALAVSSGGGGGATPPVADAGADQSVASGAAVSVDGSASTPGTGGALTYTWSQVSGPAVALTGTGPVASFTAPQGPTTVVLQVGVANAAGSATDRVSVDVAAPTGGGTPPVNVARTATATASSSDGEQTPDKAIDGVADGYPTAPLNEWSSKKGKTGTWIQLSWPGPQTLTRVVLDDRPNTTDQVRGGTLQFSDGSQVAVGELPNDGSPLEVTFPSRSVTSVRFLVTSVLSGTRNVGLAEFEAWTPGSTSGGGPTPPVADAGPDRSVDSGAVVSVDGSASSAGSGGALAFSWSQVSGPSVVLSGSGAVRSFSAPVGPASVVLELSVSNGAGSATDRVTISVAAAPVTPPVADAGPDRSVDSGAVVSVDGSASSAGSGGALAFSWSQVSGPSVVLSGSGAVRSFSAPVGPASVVLELSVSNGAGSATDRVTISVAAPSTGPVNLARSATATASSEDGDQTAARAIDGVSAGYPDSPLNEWSSLRGMVGTWLQLDWSAPQTVSRVVLHDRPNPTDQVRAGVLQFSDGSQVAVGSLPNDGSGLTVTFPARSVTSVRFVVTKVWSGTRNVGLAELEVWGS